jgi:hypothetical protein
MHWRPKGFSEKRYRVSEVVSDVKIEMSPFPLFQHYCQHSKFPWQAVKPSSTSLFASCDIALPSLLPNHVTSVKPVFTGSKSWHFLVTQSRNWACFFLAIKISASHYPPSLPFSVSFFRLQKVKCFRLPTGDCSTTNSIIVQRSGRIYQIVICVQAASLLLTL